MINERVSREGHLLCERHGRINVARCTPVSRPAPSGRAGRARQSGDAIRETSFRCIVRCILSHFYCLPCRLSPLSPFSSLPPPSFCATAPLRIANRPTTAAEPFGGEGLRRTPLPFPPLFLFLPLLDRPQSGNRKLWCQQDKCEGRTDERTDADGITVN